MVKLFLTSRPYFLFGSDTYIVIWTQDGTKNLFNHFGKDAFVTTTIGGKDEIEGGKTCFIKPEMQLAKMCFVYRLERRW